MWLRRCSTSLEDARATLLELRRVIIDVCGMDAATEPRPLIGRSVKVDLVTLVAYLGDLLARGSSAARCGPQEVARRVIAALPRREDTTLGA